MKTLLSSLAVVLLCSMSVFAQKPVQDLPELQEWYSWPGAKGSHISYLPGFSDQGGMNAITQKRDGDPTWFNRFAFDTTNQFSWNGGSYSVVQLDFNGDGIADYIDGEGRVYRGVEKNKPPVLVDGAIYFRGGTRPNVGDFNGDGFDDLLITFQGTTFRMLFGGKDLLHLRSTLVAMPQYTFAVWTGISAYINESGKGRFISYRKDYQYEGFYLFGLTFEATPNDSIIVGLELLSSIQEKADKNQQIFQPSASGLYSNKSTYERTLLVATSNGEVMVYSTVIDKFSLQLTKKSGVAPLYLLQGSIDGDSIQDIAMMILYNNIPRICIFPGSPLLGFEPRAVLGVGSGECDYSSSVYYIGDVTGDGIGDIALGNNYGSCFAIYKGIDWRITSIETEAGKVDFILKQSEPNPIGNEGKAILPATLSHTGSYILEVYDLAGKRLGELFTGELPIGDVRIPFDLKPLNIPSGMFILRLSDGQHSQERAFVITK